MTMSLSVKRFVTYLLLFTSQEDFVVCGDAENGLEAVEMAQLVFHCDPANAEEAQEPRGKMCYRLQERLRLSSILRTLEAQILTDCPPRLGFCVELQVE